MNGLITYLKGSIYELKHNIEWIKKSELVKSTTMVAIAVVIVSIICFSIDWSLVKVINGLYKFLIDLK